MTDTNKLNTPEYYRNLPKVELHRHLEGSLRIPTMMEIAKTHDLDVKNIGYLRPLVQIEHKDPYTFENFLSKFDTLRSFYKSPEIIKRLTWEAVEDAALDNIRYLELRFTPAALSQSEGFPLAQVFDWVIDSVKTASSTYGIQVKLIVSVNRHESVSQAEKVIEIALNRQDQGVVGIDLAGNEANFPADPFRDLFSSAKKLGLRVTIHAGEWGSAENVQQAIEDFGADRIGHGVRVLENPNIIAIARERGTLFEVCVTSNHHSGVVKELLDHPYQAMIQKGLNVTFNTDDPSISKISLSSEYKTIHEKFGMPMEKLAERVYAAVEGAFLQEDLRNKLAVVIAEEFKIAME
jgi:adenosine deaminase